MFTKLSIITHNYFFFLGLFTPIQRVVSQYIQGFLRRLTYKTGQTETRSVGITDHIAILRYRSKLL